jgi:hypothetical protein
VPPSFRLNGSDMRASHDAGVTQGERQEEGSLYTGAHTPEHGLDPEVFGGLPGGGGRVTRMVRVTLRVLIASIAPPRPVVLRTLPPRFNSPA